jgi:tetratricopeptide (TPR) repeat protein
MAAAAAGVVLLLGGTYYVARGPEIPVEHPPVTVVIADFKNETGDAAFNGTVEPIVKLGLEDAAFISAFDRSAISRTLGVRPPEVLDEKAAVELAVKQGVGVVLSGTLTKDGNRFRVAAKVSETVSGNVIAEEAETASTKDGVLAAVASVASDMRQALGDNRSDSTQRFVKDTLSATSLEAVRLYSNGMEALSRSQFDEALKAFSAAAAKDPKFGLAYAGMAIASNNRGRRQDAEKYAKEALGLVDSMTERERYRTRAMFYSITSDYQPCVREYGDLIAKYPADTVARNNRANCLGKLRDMKGAAEELRQALKILPNRSLYRLNLATYSSYMGDSATAREESQRILADTPWALQTLAMAQTLDNQLSEAAQTYRAMAKHEQLGPYYTASGLGDLAVYEGRFADAARIFTDTAAAQIAAKDADLAGAKLAALAYTELLRDRKAPAIAAAERALEATQARGVRFLAARVLIEAGAPQPAKRIAVALGNDLLPEAQALASILDGMIALADGDNRNALRFMNDANTQLDTWIGHFELGRVYLKANQFLQADSEFDRCVTRRGEVLQMSLDDEPTFGYFPAVHYYQGKAREGLKSTRAAESFNAYLAIRGQSKDDPLVAELRKRVATN